VTSDYQAETMSVIRDTVAGELGDAATQGRRRLSLKHAGLLGAAIVLGVAAIALGARWWTVGRFIASTDDAYVGGNVTEIAPHVSGFIGQITVTDNQYVRAGQLLIRIEPADFKASRERAAAMVAQAQASVGDLEARIALQRSLIAQAQADLAASRDQMRFDAEDAARDRALARAGAGSVRDAQHSATAYQAAQATTLAAQARVSAARQQVAVLGAALRQAQAASGQATAQLRTASLNLGYTEIRSPIDGYVGDRSAQIGEYVTAGTQLLSIAPAHGLWVDANFKEDQIGRIRPGQPATIVADVDSGHVFHGHVVSLAPATGAVFSIIPPQNATGNFTKIVQRVPVRIVLDGAGGTLGLLRPGLSTTASVDTRDAGDSAP
jgi:membrane fusion protein, multidrug efflux system